MRRFKLHLLALFILMLSSLSACVHPNPFSSQVSSTSYSDPLEVHFIDVGQGDAILIRSPSHETILIDTGPLSAGHTVMHYLQKLNVNKIDYLIVTHMHQDHAGGLFYLLPQFPVGTIYDNGAVLSGNDIYEEYMVIVRNLEIPRKTLHFGDRLRLPGLILDVFSPIGDLSGNMNEDSIVTQLRYGDVTFLLAADLTKKGEKKIVEKGASLNSRVLKVGHHGACDATSQAFLDAVKPDIAVITVSEDNRFGYPCKETLRLLTANNIRTIRTGISGTIVIKSDGMRFWIQQ